MNDPGSTAAGQPQPKWQPLGRIERRVLGVLVEKAKTTPDAYPMTLNALTNGCNQKSNRDPQMNLSPDQIETSLEKLRALGAVLEVSGGGRVAKYRHLMYEWMGVEKVEAAVMTELLLRGSQSVGELRGRAARMDPIADVQALQPILESLIEKKLVLSLTPPGRGQVVTHALYQPEEMAKVRAAVGAIDTSSTAAAASAPVSATAPGSTTAASPNASVATSASATSAGVSASGTSPAVAAPQASVSPTAAVPNGEIAELREEVRKLQAEVERLKADLQDLWSNLT